VFDESSPRSTRGIRGDGARHPKIGPEEITATSPTSRQRRCAISTRQASSSSEPMVNPGDIWSAQRSRLKRREPRRRRMKCWRPSSARRHRSARKVDSRLPPGVTQGRVEVARLQPPRRREGTMRDMASSGGARNASPRTATTILTDPRPQRLCAPKSALMGKGRRKEGPKNAAGHQPKREVLDELAAKPVMGDRHCRRSPPWAEVEGHTARVRGRQERASSGLRRQKCDKPRRRRAGSGRHEDVKVFSP